MAQLLVGYDVTGTILRFDEDGDILAGGTKLNECFFLNFSRLLTKDEIKKGSFTLSIGSAPNYTSANSILMTITDSGAQNDFRVNSPAGEYAMLSASLGGAYSASYGANINGICGLIYYQAGVVVLTASLFLTSSQGGKVNNSNGMTSFNETINQILTGSSISGTADALRHRIANLQFNNTTELNSTIYFCRAHNNDFNYSSNPTYLSGSKIHVKNSSLDAPVSYITTVGLYSSDNELLAVAKVSEPLKKDPSTEFTLRCRLDY